MLIPKFECVSRSTTHLSAVFDLVFFSKTVSIHVRRNIYDFTCQALLRPRFLSARRALLCFLFSSCSCSSVICEIFPLDPLRALPLSSLEFPWVSSSLLKFPRVPLSSLKCYRFKWVQMISLEFFRFKWVQMSSLEFYKFKWVQMSSFEFPWLRLLANKASTWYKIENRVTKCIWSHSNA